MPVHADGHAGCFEHSHCYSARKTGCASELGESNLPRSSDTLVIVAGRKTGDSQSIVGDASRSERDVHQQPVLSVDRARERASVASKLPVLMRAQSITKRYGDLYAAADVSFEVHEGSLTGVVGPNGAGKTTVLSMISGLNRPTSGRIFVGEFDVWSDGPKAKRIIGSLPDRLRLFDRLTGAQLLMYAAVLQGVEGQQAKTAVRQLSEAFGLDHALGRPVTDYSAGMQKKIGLACAMIHSPKLLVLDEPYETIDPVSAVNVTEILEKFVAQGGSVIMSSHSLDLIQRMCDHVVVIAEGSVVAAGTVDQVRAGMTLEERFSHLTGPGGEREGLQWL